MKATKKGASKAPAKAKKSSNAVAASGPKKKPSAAEKKPKKADSSVGPKRKGSQSSFISKNEGGQDPPEDDPSEEKQFEDPAATMGEQLVAPDQRIEEEDSKLEESPDVSARRQSAVDMGIVQDFFLGGGVNVEGAEALKEEQADKTEVNLDSGEGLAGDKEIPEETVPNSSSAPLEPGQPPAEDPPAEEAAGKQQYQESDPKSEVEGEESKQEEPLEKKPSKETQGENLQEVAEDVKSFAHTDVVGGQQQSSLFFDGQAEKEKEEAMTNFDKFKEQNPEQAEDEDLNQIGFMDELDDIQPVNTLDVQADQKDLILSSWTQVNEIGRDPVGRILMRNIFEQAPAALDLYSFKDVPNLYTSSELKAHYTKLITALDEAIQTLSSPKDIQKNLKALGKRHVKYGVVKEHYNVIGRSLLMTLDEGLNEDFTPQVRSAWITLIQQISAYMISDNYDSVIQEEEGEDDPITPNANARLPSHEGGDPLELRQELPQEAEAAPTPPIDEVQILTVSKVRTLKRTWALAQKVENLDVKIYQNLFDIAPAAIELFSFKDIPNLFESKELKQHASNVLEAIGMAIEGIDQLDPAIPTLTKLGREHQAVKGVEAFHFELLHSAIQFTIEEHLKSEYNNEVKDAWATAFNIIKNVMLENISRADLPKYIQRARTLEITKEEVDSDSHDLYREKSNPKKVQKLLSADAIQDPDHDQIAEQIKRENTILERMSSIAAPPVPVPPPKEVEVIPEVDKMMRTTQLIRNEAKKHYHERFKAEVDFHHKIQFRFEKAYRLGLKMQDQKRRLNLEIIDLISDFAGYIEHDPMCLFYCLYFCIYYNNEELVEFLRNVISKVKQIPRIEKLIEFIDIYGIPKLREVGEQINQLVFHMVFYQAVDDNLRIVYAQIFKLLRFIQLRDKDALQLLNQRDYELIKLSFDKYTTKINLLQFYSKASPLKASTYRKYNQAYFEEIVINNHIEERVALNYRERFLVTPQDIFIVFEMYCKEDYDEQFQSTRKDDITHKQFIDLFIICLRNDSFKIALLIYTLYLNPEEDIDDRILNILLATIQESVRSHELKLFFVHEHFNKFSVSQMNQTVDIYQEILGRKDPKNNPMVSQFNTIKITLLIYRICWKIEERQIYSLITKCSVLQNYLMSSLMQYFEKQSTVLILHKFMTEPILHMTERKDCLDIMYEMNMQELLQHPVVVEVLNLVYEGQYSVSSSPLGMSQTFFCLLEMDTMNLKSITDRLLLNVKTFGDIDSSKQSSLQYNIWKQSIEQREQDEMVFSVLINSIIMILAGLMTLLNNSSSTKGREAFGHNYHENVAYFVVYSDPVIEQFCIDEVDILSTESKILSEFIVVVIVNMLGTFTTMVQKLLTFKFKDNVKIDPLKLLFDASIVINSILLLICTSKDPSNRVISERCSDYTEIQASEETGIDRVFSLRFAKDGELDFSLIVSLLIIQTSFESIIMLKRTRYLGELIMMLTQMLEEMARFFATFGVIILLFLVVGTLLGMQIKDEKVTFYQTFLDLFLAFNGNSDLKEFTQPTGQVYMASFMYLFKVLLLSLLGAMFINKYKVLFQNIDAFKRFNIIRMKNSESYDKYIGGATLTFYPINIIIAPFLIPLMIVRNTRVSDFALKIQYTLMVVLYCLIIAILVLPAVPLLYLKSVLNAVYIVLHRVRQDYKGQNLINLVKTIALTPGVICISIFIDFLALPNLLLKRSDTFEFKYQMSTDKLSPMQLDTVNGTLDNIFGDYESRFKGFSMSLLELMKMHVKIFSIIENLHDLTCMGNKDYKEALSNVQDYNMTKTLTSKCSIPDRSGDFKLARCEIDILYNVHSDIELYNYNDVVLRKLRMNTLREDVASKAQKKKQEAANPSLKMQGMSEKKKKAILMAKEKQKAQEKNEDDSELEVINGIEQVLGPDNVPLRRNARDVMSNYFIDMVARSYTDIDKHIQKERNSIEAKKLKKFEHDLDSKKVMWRELVSGYYGTQASKYHDFLKDRMYTYKLEMKRKEKEANRAARSSNSKSPQVNACKMETSSTRMSGPGF